MDKIHKVKKKKTQQQTNEYINKNNQNRSKQVKTGQIKTNQNKQGYTLPLGIGTGANETLRQRDGFVAFCFFFVLLQEMTI